MKNIIVGAGISGIALARMLADRGEQVTVIERKSHIGGNCYDFYDENGICVHKYGTHIFHTDSKEVWDFVSRFTKWEPYMHKVLGMVDGQLVPIPFNLNSIRKVFPEVIASRLEEKLIGRFGFNRKVPILELREANDEDLSFLADYIYRKVFLIYTMKQWGLKPEEIDPSVTARVPVYVSRDDRYFQNRWQGIPSDGYTAMMERMLNHENIEVITDTSWKKYESEHLKTEEQWNDFVTNCRFFYSGAIDELVERMYGDLPYRSISFDFRTYDREYFQSAAVVNYPENYDFTRIGEYKYFLNDKSPKTVVSYEYSSQYEYGRNEPYYPIANPASAELYSKYVEAAKIKYPNIQLLGRLGDFKYYDMDKAIEKVFKLIGALKFNI